ncbi:hypothetical protein [Sphingobacterium sp. WOUb80]|uniref:hypothetical protein n=1 Tax=Sphingobacterium sp. WOUb80 TaxID=3234028 RepID=UPI003CE7A336
MDIFEINIGERRYLVKPFNKDGGLFFITEINGLQVIFGGTGNGLEAIDPPNIDDDLLDEIASEIDSYMM